MSEKVEQQPKPEKPMTITIQAPETVDVKIVLPHRDLSTLVTLVRKSTELCWFSNFTFLVADGLRNLEDADFEKDEITLVLAPLVYTEQDALAHAQQTARILYTASSHSEYSDCKQSVSAWVTRTCGKIAARIEDYTNPFPPNYLQTIPSVVKHFDISNTQITMAERLQNIYFKMDITTAEKQNFDVFCALDGWYVDPKKKHSSLHLLLKEISPFFRENFSLVANKWVNLLPLEKVPYIPLQQKQILEPIRREKSPHEQLRLFTQTVNNSIECSLEDSCPPDLDDNSIISIEESYIKSIIYAITLIKRGRLQPINGEKTYAWRGLLITNVRDIEGFENFETALKVIGSEPHSFALLSKVKPDQFQASRSTCIDLFGDRWVARQAIPGLLQGNAKTVYGFAKEDKEHKNFLMDERFAKFFEENAETIGLASSSIKGSDKPIFSTSDAKGIVAPDGSLIISGMTRTTPRDANFPDIPYAVIRQEACASFATRETLRAHHDELVALGGDPDHDYEMVRSDEEGFEEKYKALMSRRVEIIKETPRIPFDLNALTKDSTSTEVPENIRQVSTYIKEVLIPNFIKTHIQTNNFFYDCRSFVNEMHSRGINVRYLGYIYQLLDDSNVLEKYAKMIIESDMVARTIKSRVRSENLKLPQFLEIVNQVIKGDLSNVNTEAKFGIAVKQVTTEMQLPFIDSLFTQLGIKIREHDYSEPVNIEDIVGIVPRIIFPFHKSSSFLVAVDIATNCYLNGDHETAFQVFQSVLQISDQCTNAFDPQLSQTYFYLALLLIEKGDSEGALDCILRSVLIHERYVDQTNPELILRLEVLAQIHQELGNKQLAFAFAARAASLALQVAPSHPWTVTALQSAAEIGAYVDPPAGVVFASYSIQCAIALQLEETLVARLLHQAAICSLKAGDGVKALSFAQQAVEMHDCEEHRSVLEMIKGQITIVPKPAHKSK